MNKKIIFILNIAILSFSVAQASTKMFDKKIVEELARLSCDRAAEALFAASGVISPDLRRDSCGTNEAQSVRGGVSPDNNSPILNESFPSCSEILAAQYAEQCRKGAVANEAYARERLEETTMQVMIADAQQGLTALTKMVENAQNHTSREARRKIERACKEQKISNFLARAAVASEEEKARFNLENYETDVLRHMAGKFNKKMKRLDRVRFSK